MIRLFTRKTYKNLSSAFLAILVLFCFLFAFMPECVSAAVDPAISLQVGSAYSETALFESGAQGTALVILDCGDFTFKSGSVKISMDATLFTDVTAKSDADVITKVDTGADVISIRYSFDSAEGFHGTMQLGSVSFTVKETESSSVETDLKISEVRFTDDKANNHTDDFGIKDVVITVENKNVTGTVIPGSAVPTSTSTSTSTAIPATGSPGSTAENELINISATPTVTDSTELLTDTAMYTLEDVEDLSNGAIVFWGIVFLIVGVWIGIGLGYWIWCKKKTKPQVKDTHDNVIGHLK